MTNRIRSTAFALLALLALTACGDDSTGPENEIYRATTVEVGNSVLPLPALLYSGPITFPSDPTAYTAEEKVPRATLILEKNGRYELNGTYQLFFRPASAPPNSDFDLIEVPVFERGTYRRTANAITFTADEGNSLDLSGTLRNGVLTLDVEDPFFGDSNTFTFER